MFSSAACMAGDLLQHMAAMHAHDARRAHKNANDVLGGCVSPEKKECRLVVRQEQNSGQVPVSSR